MREVEWTKSEKVQHGASSLLSLLIGRTRHQSSRPFTAQVARNKPRVPQMLHARRRRAPWPRPSTSKQASKQACLLPSTSVARQRRDRQGRHTASLCAGEQRARISRAAEAARHCRSLLISDIITFYMPRTSCALNAQKGRMLVASSHVSRMYPVELTPAPHAHRDLCDERMRASRTC